MIYMKNKNSRITILVIGDRADYDSHNKLHQKREFILGEGFDYKRVSYEALLNGRIPKIKTEKVIIFFFFPFVYWNKHIEHRRYRGTYGNITFHRKFKHFCQKVVGIIKYCLPDKDLLFINDPLRSSLYRDKKLVMTTLAKEGISIPHLFDTKSVDDINRLLEKGRKLFIKPQCGSMGKGITFLQRGDWQTNFEFKNNRIVSRKSDRGWRFRDVTANTKFLESLLQKDVLIEEAVESLSTKGDKIDFRVYTFFDKVLYVYPRRNRADGVTTNISQGGRGAPGLLRTIPDRVLSEIKKTTIKATEVLKLNFTGIDVIIDKTLKDFYVIDVNMFPGFPKTKTFNLPRRLISELKRLDNNGLLRYEKGGRV